MSQKKKFYFCTLFDSGYLTRGLVMYDSLILTGLNFELAVFPFDHDSEEILTNLNIPQMRIISRVEWEDERLKSVRPNRTVAEYCWTSTSTTILYCLEKLGWPEVTYLDADLYFYNTPVLLFEEAGDASVILTKHNYARQYDQSGTSGTYCVQFMRFLNNEFGLTPLKWWRDRCLEWCYARHEDGKFGDQAYLEDWKTRFPNVHVIVHQGAGVAPWNVREIKVNEQDSRFSIFRNGKEFDLIFYHFHGIRLYQDSKVGFDNYLLKRSVIKMLYIPYVKKLISKAKILGVKYPSVKFHRTNQRLTGLKAFPGWIKNKLSGTYNFFPLSRFN